MRSDPEVPSGSEVPAGPGVRSEPEALNGSRVPSRTSWLRRVLMLAVTAVLLVLTARLVGTEALLAGWDVLTPTTIAAALGCGLLVTLAQALRWTLLAREKGIPMRYARAVADCWSSSLGNMVLPGGIAGDAARVAFYRGAGDRRWWSPAAALGAERLSSTTLLLSLSAVILAGISARLAVIAGAVAVLALAAALACMRGMAARTAVLVWGAAAVGVGALLGLYLIGMAVLGGPVAPSAAAVGLASMSVPLGVGGWGVREISVGVLAGELAVTAEWAVTAATAFGLLATTSTLPGAVALLPAALRRRRTGAPAVRPSVPAPHR